MDIASLSKLWQQARQAQRASQAWAVVVDPADFSKIEDAMRAAWAVDPTDVVVAEPEEGKRVLSRAVLKPWLAQVSLAPRGEIRLAILRHAEMLQPVTANLLLKPLEEPAAGTVFLLLLARDTLLPTLRSRVQLAVIEQLPNSDKMILPESVSALLTEAATWAKGDDWASNLQRLISTLRDGVRQGTVDPTLLEEALALATTNTAGLNRKLQLSAILSQTIT